MRVFFRKYTQLVHNDFSDRLWFEFICFEFVFEPNIGIGIFHTIRNFLLFSYPCVDIFMIFIGLDTILKCKIILIITIEFLKCCVIFLWSIYSPIRNLEYIGRNGSFCDEIDGIFIIFFRFNILKRSVYKIKLIFSNFPFSTNEILSEYGDNIFQCCLSICTRNICNALRMKWIMSM